MQDKKIFFPDGISAKANSTHPYKKQVFSPQKQMVPSICVCKQDQEIGSALISVQLFERCKEYIVTLNTIKPLHL
jgi:hypothetical protein